MLDNWKFLTKCKTVKREWRRVVVAANGFMYAVRSERHCQYHLIATTLVVGVSLWVGVSRVEAAVLALAIGLVWVAELLNTAIERLVDQRSRNRSVTSKIIKDIAASAVLVAALISSTVGGIILGPYVMAQFHRQPVFQEGY